MQDILNTIMTISPAWQWLIAGLIIILLELILPGVYLLWLGVASLCVALTCSFLDISLMTQFLVFAGSSFILVTIAYIYFKKRPISSENAYLNERMSSYIGREVELLTAIKNGTGRICVDDTFWVVEGAELPQGTLCTITGIRGMRFQVIRVGD